MKLLKDKKIIVLAFILIIFTVTYFWVANKISYSFSYDNDLNHIYDTVVDTIKKCAVEYANQNPKLFEEENVIYIKVQDLIDKHLLIPDNEGDIINPINKNDIFNSKVIKIKYDNNNYIVEIDA